jgi:hypothetical protein
MKHDVKCAIRKNANLNDNQKREEKIGNPLTQHFEKSVVIHVLADVIEVIVLACREKLRPFCAL